MLSLVAAHRLSLVVASRGYSLVAVCGLLIAVTSLVAEQGLKNTSSAVMVLGLSCSEACGIFLSLWSDLSPALAGGFLTTGHQGSHEVVIYCNQLIHCRKHPLS